jgi:hypothetical protein
MIGIIRTVLRDIQVGVIGIIRTMLIDFQVGIFEM